ncbi:uncharacterized protein [Triticum aestivum]|uniref:uncharacterized protein n=1 Tax=Triticum aestivum TaxID=4565 RepID=UPI001D009643|nr:uncharacterized protein LOC123140670 [Triticum aestivum]
MAGVGRGMGRGCGDGKLRTVGVVAGVHGPSQETIPACQGRGHGSGSVTIPVDHSSGGQATGFLDDINRSGFATGVARQGGISRGLEVPLPVKEPTIGNANDITNIWCHGKSLEGQAWECGYCGLVRHGGGSTRFKQHIAGLGPHVFSCMNAPHHVVAIFRKAIPEGEARRRTSKEGKKRVVAEVNHMNNQGAAIHIDCEDEDDEVLQ